jgi:aminopeptidase N
VLGVVALAMSLVACASDAGVTEGTSVNASDGLDGSTTTAPPIEPPAPSTDTAPDPAEGPTLPGTSLPPEPTDPPETTAAAEPPDTTVPPPILTTPEPPPGSDPDGIGDSLFPELGNPGLDVQDYLVQLAYDRQADELVGSVTLTIELTQDRSEITLDSAGPDVDAVTVDGADATFEEEDRELRITPADPLIAGDEIVVVVAYHQSQPATAGSLSGLASGWFNSDDGSYVLNEPDGARTWLPSNDHPSDKATWTFEITVPTGVTAVANGALVSTTPGPSGDTWVWRQDDPMATYLIQLLTGDYELIEGEGPNGLPLLSVVLRSDLDVMQTYVETIPEQMDFLDDYFGPFPLDHYGIAMTDSFPGLAMETQGRSLFSREDFTSGTLGYVEQLLLSHEMTHQWFGDAVTLGRWQDIWLNEGFATYGEWLWMDHVGIAALEDQAANAIAGRSSIGQSPADPSVTDLFGFSSYQGGAAVLHALRLTVGDDAFFETLQQWVVDFNGTSRTTEDFVELSSKVAGTDLTDFFETWLYGTSSPDQYPSGD